MADDYTPLPWTYDGSSCITDERGRIIVCLMHDMCPEATIVRQNEAEADANMALIVRAANNHDALLTACKATVRELGMQYGGTNSTYEAIALARAAIAAVTVPVPPAQ